MKSYILYISAAICVVILFSCGSDTVVQQQEQGDTYLKVASAESGNLKFELWSASGDSMMTGYNKVGFKVFEGGSPKSSGFVKFFAKMYHRGAVDMHATPIEPKYNYNSSLEMFTGYIIMLMPSDTTGSWYGFYNYNDAMGIDSVTFDVGWTHEQKFKIFVDLNTGLSYLITVLEPMVAARNMNTFKFMMHESPNFINFTQVNGAVNYITVQNDSLNHFSSGNVNPVDNGSGTYEGKVNFDNGGIWKVNDSVFYDNKWITATDPPAVIFVVP
jgi:hypothetical protein